VTRGSTYDNAANLAPSFMERIAKKYEGTRLGRQELHAEMLDDVPGALWQRQNIEQHRVSRVPDLVRIIVGVDPAMTSGEDSNETGIIIAGKSRDGHVYVLAGC
jgi:phage terminase large subunit-like protein